MAADRYTVWDDALSYLYFYSCIAVLLIFLCVVDISPMRVSLSVWWFKRTAANILSQTGSYITFMLLLRAWLNNRQKAAALKQHKPLTNSPMGTRAGWLAVILWTVAALCLCLTGFKGPAPGILAPYTDNLFSIFFFCFPAGWLFWVVWRHASAAFVPETITPDFGEQAPHGRAQFATADDLRRGGFID